MDPHKNISFVQIHVILRWKNILQLRGCLHGLLALWFWVQGFVLEMQRMDGKLEDPFFFIVNLQVSLAIVFLDRRNQDICLPCEKKWPFTYYFIWKSNVHEDIWYDHIDNVKVAFVHVKNGYFNLKGRTGLCVEDPYSETLSYLHVFHLYLQNCLWWANPNNVKAWWGKWLIVFHGCRFQEQHATH